MIKLKKLEKRLIDLIINCFIMPVNIKFLACFIIFSITVLYKLCCYVTRKIILIKAVLVNITDIIYNESENLQLVFPFYPGFLFYHEKAKEYLK